MLTDELSIALINNWQGGFPLCDRPFETLATSLQTDAASVLGRIEDLLRQGYLSRFGPLYDALQMGGGLTLAALAVDEAHFDEVADQVNGFTEVAHNYRREHRLNMWFVIATETPGAVQKVIQRIEQQTGLTVYDCPKQQEFFIGLQLHIDSDGQVGTLPMRADWLPQRVDKVMSLDATERQIIRHTQAGLPLLEQPYAELARQTGIDTAQLLQRLQRMLQNGIIRRIGVVPNHYKLGLRGNGMTVWNVPDERIDAVGRKLAALDFVSHCYQRPRHLPHWPFNLFAMVHGTDKVQAMARMQDIEQVLLPDVFEHQVLFSTAVLKKTGLRIAA